MNKLMRSPFLLLMLVFFACRGQEEARLSMDSIQHTQTSQATSVQVEQDTLPRIRGPLDIKDFDAESDPTLKINTYVSKIFQDSKGNIWFGTMVMGVAKYDGQELRYFTQREGFPAEAVRDFVEDQAGNVWLATSAGISKYDGTSFTHFGESEGLPCLDVRSIAIDKQGLIWTGTAAGAFRFNQQSFSLFELPQAAPDTLVEITGGKMVYDIMIDSKGRIYFGTNGGVYIYDGKTLSKLSEQDGLCNDAVNAILEDRTGQFWFATRHNGVCSWDGESFTHYATKADLYGNINAWDVFQDKMGDIWFPIEGVGMYRFDGKETVEMFQPQSCVSHAIMNTYEDREGRIWFGGWLGVYRLENGR